MSLPIPYHLRETAEIIKSTKDTLTLLLRCKCGCEKFTLWENTCTAEERAVLAEYEAQMRPLMRGGRLRIYSDAAGNVHWQKKRFLHPAEEITLPPEPVFASLKRFCVRCAECGTETVLFDSRFHGYDGAVCGTDVPADYEPLMKQKYAKREPARRIRVELECTVPPEEFAEIMGYGAATDNLYSECFTHIQIAAGMADGKFRTVLAMETA